MFEKGQFLLDEGDEQKCSTCTKDIDVRKSLFVVCHTEHCRGISHVRCLADASLRKDQSAAKIIPESGMCPDCRKEYPWLELMQQVTLRTRGMKEVKKLLAKRGKKSTAVVAAEMMEAESEDSDLEDEEARTAKQIVDEETDLSSGDDDDRSSVASVDSLLDRASNVGTANRVRSDPKLEIVIEDSEDER